MLSSCAYSLLSTYQETSVLLSVLALASNDLSKHDNTVTLHKGNAGQTLADLEGLDNESLEGLEGDLGHLVRLEGMGVLHLLTTGVLSNLPVDLAQLASRVTSSNEGDGGVTDLDLSGNIEDLDLSGEVLALLEGAVLLVDHDITSVGHVLLDETLNVASNVVTRLGLIELLVVHLDGEDLSSAGGGRLVSRNEDDLLVALDDTLLDTAGKDITNTLNLVDTRDGHSHVGVGVSLWDNAEVVQGIQQSVDVDGLTTESLNVNTLPPGHLVRSLDEVITHPSRDGENGDRLINELLLPADLGKHVLHLRSNLVVSVLGVSSGIRVHLVDSDQELLDTQKVDQTSVLSGLSLDLTSLVVTLGDGGGEVTVSGNHEEGDIGLRGTSDHVLNEISVAGGIDDSVVPLISVELLSGTRDGDTSLSLLLLSIHVEGEGERRLSKAVSLSLELLKLTLVDTTELEEESTSGSRLTRVDVTANNDRDVLLSVRSHCS